MRKKPYILCFVFVCIVPSTAFAYLDPGSGSLLLSSLVALFASALFIKKSFKHKCLLCEK